MGMEEFSEARRVIDQLTFEDEVYYGKRDFSHCQLTNISFPRESPDLAGASFAGAKLVRCQITKVDLSGADLSEAILQDCDLQDSNLQNGHFEKAKLIDTLFNQCNFTSASLRHSVCAHSIFDRCRLSGADLSYAHVDRSTFEHIDVGAGVHGRDTVKLTFKGAEEHQRKAYVEAVQTALESSTRELDGIYAPNRLALIEAVQHEMRMLAQEQLVKPYGLWAGMCMERSNATASALKQAYEECIKFMGLTKEPNFSMRTLTRVDLYEQVRKRIKILDAEQSNYEQQHDVQVAIDNCGDGSELAVQGCSYRLVRLDPDTARIEAYPNSFKTFISKEEACNYIKARGLIEISYDDLIRDAAAQITCSADATSATLSERLIAARAKATKLQEARDASERKRNIHPER